MGSQPVEDESAIERMFRNWVNEYSDPLFLYARKRLPDEETARDVLQDSFVAAWRNIRSYRGETSVKSWLYIILKSRIIDHYRKTARAFETEELIEPADPFFDETSHWREGRYPAEWVVQFRDPVEVRDFRRVLKLCSRKLKEMQYAVFVMKYLDGLDSEEICESLGLSVSNFWVLMHRAKVRLRACMEKNWLEK